MLFEDPCGTKVNLWAFLVPVRKHAMSRRADVLARAKLMILQMPRQNMCLSQMVGTPTRPLVPKMAAVAYSE